LRCGNRRNNLQANKTVQKKHFSYHTPKLLNSARTPSAT